jgi:hypothetical protein
VVGGTGGVGGVRLLGPKSLARGGCARLALLLLLLPPLLPRCSRTSHLAKMSSYSTGRSAAHSKAPGACRSYIARACLSAVSERNWSSPQKKTPYQKGPACEAGSRPASGS